MVLLIYDVEFKSSELMDVIATIERACAMAVPVIPHVRTAARAMRLRRQLRDLQGRLAAHVPCVRVGAGREQSREHPWTLPVPAPVEWVALESRLVDRRRAIIATGG